jgi:hypothetical protein
MNKEDLIKLGVTDEAVIQSIIVLHGKDIEKHKSDLTATTTELTNTKSQLQEAGMTIEGFKKLDVEGVKKSADEWKEKAEKAEANAQVQIAKMKFDFALDQGLNAAKARNPKAVKALLTMENLKLSEDGQLEGLDDQLKKIKETDDYQFESDEQTPRIVAGGSDKSVIADAVVVAARKAAGLKD